MPRAQRYRVHRNPHSTYRDDAYAPLHEAGWREEEADLRKMRSGIFLARIWTTQIALNWLLKFVLWRSAFCVVLDTRQRFALTDLLGAR